MTDDAARRIAADYLATLDDREAAAFLADARAVNAEMREFAKALFADADAERVHTRALFDTRRTTTD